MYRVWPSGAERATNSDAILPPAPGLFSTTTCWPHISESRALRMRPMPPMPPPGENGTTRPTTQLGGCKERVPRRHVKSRHTRFHHGRELRCGREALGRRHREPAQLSCPRLLQHAADGVEHYVDAAWNDVVQGERHAAIGHVRHLD